jgi:hypothetical protein
MLMVANAGLSSDFTPQFRDAASEEIFPTKVMKLLLENAGKEVFERVDTGVLVGTIEYS